MRALTEERRARRREQMKARYRVGDTTRPPTLAPDDLHERLGQQILRTLATEPELIGELLCTNVGASYGRSRS